MARALRPGRRRSASGPEVEASREFGGRLGIGQCLRTGFRDHDQVDHRMQVGSTGPEQLAHDALHPVPDDRIADPLAHRYTEPRLRAGGGVSDENEVCGVTPAPLTLDPKVLAPTAHACRL